MTTSNNHRRYWDSCNWISLIAEDEVERANICERILEDAADGTGVVITSALTLAEVVKKKESQSYQNQMNAQSSDSLSNHI